MTELNYLDQKHAANKREKNKTWKLLCSRCFAEGFYIVREFLLKLLKRLQRWIKHCIIHAPDLILIEMKQGCEIMMAASPRNRSDSLLSPRPEGCVHSSELLLGPDEGCSDADIFLLVGLRRCRKLQRGDHTFVSQWM